MGIRRKGNCEWWNDIPSGQGTVIWADGTIYVGEFLKGMYSGEGTLLTNDAFYGKLSLSFDYFKKNIVDCDNTIALIKEHEKSIIIESICNNLIDDNLVQRRLIKFNYSTDTMTYIKEYNKIGDVVRKVSFVDYRVNNLKVFPLEIQIDEPRKRKKTKFKFTEFEFINNK